MENAWKLEKWPFLSRKKQNFHCPVALDTAFSAKFLLDAKVQNIGFWNISN